MTEKGNENIFWVLIFLNLLAFIFVYLLVKGLMCKSEQLYGQYFELRVCTASCVQSAEIALQQMFMKNIASFCYQEQTSFDELVESDELVWVMSTSEEKSRSYSLIKILSFHSQN